MRVSYTGARVQAFWDAMAANIRYSLTGSSEQAWVANDEPQKQCSGFPLPVSGQGKTEVSQDDRWGSGRGNIWGGLSATSGADHRRFHAAFLAVPHLKSPARRCDLGRVDRACTSLKEEMERLKPVLFELAGEPVP